MNKLVTHSLTLLIASFGLSAMAQDKEYSVAMPWSGSADKISVEDKEVAKTEITNSIVASIAQQQRIDPSMYNAGPQPVDTTEQTVLKKYKPRMTVTTEVGGNEMLPIAIGLPNRIKTNFKEIEVVGNFNENVYVSQEGGYLTISVGSSNALGLFLREYGMPETEVAVTLFPFNIGQAMIDMTIKMPASMVREASRRLTERKNLKKINEALVHERAEDKYTKEYIEKHSTILEAVANATDPRGFVLQKTSALYPCPLLNNVGIKHSQLQRYTSSRQTIDIVQIKNTTTSMVDFDELYCMMGSNKYGEVVTFNDVIAVGSYPKSTLRPGEEAEVYILRKNEIPSMNKKSRKRLIAE